MGNAVKSLFFAQDIEANNITNLNSTDTTSLTFVTTLTVTTAGSSSLGCTKQTMYFNKGIIQNFSTVTTTYVAHPI